MTPQELEEIKKRVEAEARLRLFETFLEYGNAVWPWAKTRYELEKKEYLAKYKEGK